MLKMSTISSKRDNKGKPSEDRHKRVSEHKGLILPENLDGFEDELRLREQWFDRN